MRLLKRSWWLWTKRPEGMDAWQWRITGMTGRETLLFHLLRGTGLDGMASIRPVRPLCAQNPEGPRVIRPLLETERTKIEAFLQKRGVSWRTDSTNEGERYARNRIRNRILPYAEETICPAARKHLAQEARLLGELSDFMAERTREALERCEEEGDADGLFSGGLTAFEKNPRFMQKLCVRDCLRRVGGGRNLTSAHVEAALALGGGKDSERSAVAPARMSGRSGTGIRTAEIRTLAAAGRGAGSRGG